MDLTEAFQSIADPRVERHKRHLLQDILFITVCSFICGADKWTEEEFQACFLAWIKSISEITQGEIIAIDGKTLRRPHYRSNKTAAIHMVSAWACNNGLVIGQLKTEEKSNEITAIPKLLKLLEIKDCIVTIDAMGCQKEIAQTIQKQGADYVLALKGNQGTLHKDVTLYLDSAINKDDLDPSFNYHETTDGDHGRVEVRRYWISNNVTWLERHEDWIGLRSIGLVEVRETH